MDGRANSLVEMRWRIYSCRQLTAGKRGYGIRLALSPEAISNPKHNQKRPLPSKKTSEPLDVPQKSALVIRKSLVHHCGWTVDLWFERHWLNWSHSYNEYPAANLYTIKRMGSFAMWWWEAGVILKQHKYEGTPVFFARSKVPSF